MRRIVILLIVSIVLCSCGEFDSERTIERARYICSSDTVKDRADFTLDCIKNANPKSDEEPEDWIYKCKTMADETFCSLITVSIKQSRTCRNCPFEDVSVSKKEKL